MTCRFAVFGPLRVTVAGADVDLGPAKQRMALLMLLLHADRVVPLDDHYEAIWREPPASARSNLRTYLSALRRVLRTDRIPWHGIGYRIVVRPGELDLDEFDRLARTGEAALRRGDTELASGTLRQALDRWRTPEFAPERCGPRLELLLTALSDRRHAVLDQYLDAELLGGRDVTVVPVLRQGIADQPTNERLWCRLMVALARAGDIERALSAYREAYWRLDTELGVGPGEELRWVHEVVLTRDPRIGSAAALPWLGGWP